MWLIDFSKKCAICYYIIFPNQFPMNVIKTNLLEKTNPQTQMIIKPVNSTVSRKSSFQNSMPQCIQLDSSTQFKYCVIIFCAYDRSWTKLVISLRSVLVHIFVIIASVYQTQRTMYCSISWQKEISISVVKSTCANPPNTDVGNECKVKKGKKE